MDVAQLDIGITHQSVAALSLGDADPLTNQHLADKDQLTRPFDLAVAAHTAHRNVAGGGVMIGAPLSAHLESDHASHQRIDARENL
jgi:hypothetical protein